MKHCDAVCGKAQIDLRHTVVGQGLNGWQTALVAAPWNRDYLDEHETFPAGKYMDQVDASSGAFNKIASKYRYDSSLQWVS